MQSTILDVLVPYVGPAAAPSPVPPPPAAQPALAHPDLPAALATIPDPRRAQGRRFPLPAVLLLALAALLAGHRSEQAIAEWGADQDGATLRAWGFPKAITPHQATIHRLFRRLDPVALAAALNRVFDPPPATPRPRGSEGVSVDGKAHRGRLPFAPSGGVPVHALTAFSHRRRAVLAQLPIGLRAEKAEAELTVAPALLACLDGRGRVLTGDALLGQQALCRQVRGAGGDYLLMVKENQPWVYDAVRRLVDPPDGDGGPLLDARPAATTTKGHGRLETRRLVASTALTNYLDWPGLAQVLRVERTWTAPGVTKREVQYASTSLPPQIGTASRLLALQRGHWQIENGLHSIKDETLGEDRSQVHLGMGPSGMACLRDTVVSLLHRAGIDRIAERLRYHTRHPDAILALLGCSSA